MSVASLLVLSAVAVLVVAAPCRAEESCAGGPALVRGSLAGIELAAGSGRPVARIALPHPDEDGRETMAVVLDGVIVPAAVAAEAGAAARATVAGLGGNMVDLHPTHDTPDRHGRRLGALRLDDGSSLAERLLGAGAGLADVSLTPCASRHLAAEAEARAERRGIWRQSRLWTDLNRATPGLPDFVLGRGRVASVGQAGRTTYINFGDSFRTDATVRLTEATTLALTAAGHAPETLTGHRIEVRGFAAERDGLDLLLAAPAALRVVDAQD